MEGQHTNLSWANPPFSKWRTDPRSTCMLVGGSSTNYEIIYTALFSVHIHHKKICTAVWAAQKAADLEAQGLQKACIAQHRHPPQWGELQTEVLARKSNQSGHSVNDTWRQAKPLPVVVHIMSDISSAHCQRPVCLHDCIIPLAVNG